MLSCIQQNYFYKLQKLFTCHYAFTQYICTQFYFAIRTTYIGTDKLTLILTRTFNVRHVSKVLENSEGILELQYIHHSILYATNI